MWYHPPVSYTPAYPLQVGRGVVSSTSVVHTGLSPPGGAGGGVIHQRRTHRPIPSRWGGGWCHPPASYTPAYPLQVGPGGGVIHQRRTHRPIPSRWGGGVVSSTSVVHTGLSPPGGAGGGVIHQRRTHRPIPSRWGGGWCHPPASYTPAYPLQVGRGGGVIHQRRTHRPIPSRWARDVRSDVGSFRILSSISPAFRISWCWALVPATGNGSVPAGSSSSACTSSKQRQHEPLSQI